MGPSFNRTLVTALHFRRHPPHLPAPQSSQFLDVETSGSTSLAAEPTWQGQANRAQDRGGRKANVTVGPHNVRRCRYLGFVVVS
jgi:hypothetical protein